MAVDNNERPIVHDTVGGGGI